MQQAQVNKSMFLNSDKARKYLSETEAWLLMNNDILSVKGKSTPFPSNFPLCDMSLPAGENYRIGSHCSPLTNESYVWVYNSNNQHFIYRIAETKCEIVAFDECIQLSAEPENEITDWRAWMHLDENACNSHGKYLVWTDGLHDIGYLDVEASIATDSFSTPFFDNCIDRCDLYRLCVPKPCGCINAEYIPLPATEESLSNHLLNTGFKFIFKHIYYDGRESEWSDVSSLYYQDAKGCFDSSSGFPRCIRLTIPMGSPLVDRIAIGFTKGDNVWYLTDTVEKYQKYNSSQQKWYERGLVESMQNDDCFFHYDFCNNKQCQAIDPSDINRVYNPIPRQPQGLLPVAGGIGFYNYVEGVCALSKGEVSKFKVDIDCGIREDCNTEYVDVVVRAVIHNFYHDLNQFIYTLGSSDDETVYFGGLNPRLDGGLVSGYDQTFDGDVKNFIVYEEGGKTWQEMKQWRSWRGWVDRIEVGVVSDLSKDAVKNDKRKDTRHGVFYYEEAVLKFKKGTKGFLRLASHHAQGNEQDTSTFVVGVVNDIRNYKGDAIGAGDLTVEEIYFDTNDAVDNKLELFKAFLIQDNAVNTGAITSKTESFYGYIRDYDRRPIEGAIVKPTDGHPSYMESVTDHNGFYHLNFLFGIDDPLFVAPPVTFSVLAEKDCDDFEEIHSFIVSGDMGESTEANETLPYSNAYNESFFATVRTRVLDCDGLPVGGVRVALSGSKSRTTNNQGNADIRVRNYSTRNRVVRSVVVDTGGCFVVDCDGNCNPSMPTNFYHLPPCFEANPTIPLPAVRVNKDAALENKRGLKNGGRYGFGIVAQWDCGKISAVHETLPYLDIPKAQANGAVRYCGLKYDAGDMVLPDGVKCLKIVRTPNLNSFEMQWVVDSFKRTTDGKIILTIQGLNDYNEQYFFKTNTAYTYTIGDRVEFIRNGDGRLFPTSGGILNYLTISPFHDELISGKENADADYFNQLIIEDDGKLSSLKEGAVIELQRPQACTTEPAFYEICASIPVIDGKPIPRGKFYTFDTYTVNRQIGKFPVQSFEHHSPSDFWGTKLTDTGKAHFVNKYATEKRYGRNITINSPNVFNRFGDMEKTFDGQDQGDILAMTIKDSKIILGICEHDNFIAQAADDLLRVGGDGIIRALPPDSIVSDPQVRLQGKYGCRYNAIGSVHFGDNYACWVDVDNNAFVHHDFSQAKDVSEGKIKGFLSKKCSDMTISNRTQANPLNKVRFFAGRNFYNGAINLTIKALRHKGVTNATNQLLEPCNTLLYDTKSGEWLGYMGYVPEGYSYINLPTDEQCAFITFLNGLPYCHPVHADELANEWNEFYGVACDRKIGISINKEPGKIKKPVSFELQSQMMYFVEEVTQEKGNFISEIPPADVEKDGEKFNASFLANKNSIDGLRGDDMAEDFVINVLFTRDNTRGLEYKTIDNAKRTKYDELDFILFKFSVREQSGYTANL